MVKRIDKYILKEVSMPIFFGISLFTFIFLLDVIVTMMESIIVKGISVFDVLRILSFYLPPILSQTIPMGIFLGVMLTFAKLTRTSEATAMFASGLSLKRIVKPIFILTIFTTIFMFFLQESIIPRSYEKLQYLTAKISYENPVFQLKDKTYIEEMEKYNLYIDKIDSNTEKARGVLIFENDSKNKFPTILVGKEAYWEDSSMVLTDSKFYDFEDTGKDKVKGTFENKKIPLTAYFEGIKIKVSELEGMSIRELTKEVKTAEKEMKPRYYSEINRKIALPLATLMLGILGVFLSIGHNRSGKGINFTLSIIIIFGYITMLNMGIVLANRGKIPPTVGVWTPNLLLLILTILFYRRKAR